MIPSTNLQTTNDLDDEKDDLPVHTQSMRSAAEYCLNIWNAIWSESPSFVATLQCLLNEANVKTDSDYRMHQRTEAYNEFWEVELLSLAASDKAAIPLLRYSEISSPNEFRLRYHDRNIPCLIEMDDSCNYFKTLNHKWRESKDDGNAVATKCCNCCQVPNITQHVLAETPRHCLQRFATKCTI